MKKFPKKGRLVVELRSPLEALQQDVLHVMKWRASWLRVISVEEIPVEGVKEEESPNGRD